MISLMDIDRFDDSSFEGLHRDRRTGCDEFAVSGHDLIHFCEACPDDQENQESDHQEPDDMHGKGRSFRLQHNGIRLKILSLLQMF